MLGKSKCDRNTVEIHSKTLVAFNGNSILSSSCIFCLQFYAEGCAFSTLHVKRAIEEKIFQE